MGEVDPQQLAAAYSHCQAIVRGHYENFPVASLILPRRLRRPISVIYAFARTADDFADEGDWDAATRLTKLADYDQQLDAISAGQPVTDPIFIALAEVIRQHRLPVQLFHDLLTAFRRDVSTTRFETIDAVLDYCRYSANPVGRLLLQLLGAASAENLQQSDAICSALQLINFLQDVDQDYVENNRIYLPLDEMAQYGVTEADIRERRCTPAMQALVQRQIHRARDMMLSGRPLGRALPGRFGFQLRMMINGGLRILDRLEAQGDKVFSRPRLRGRDWLWMLGQAI